MIWFNTEKRKKMEFMQNFVPTSKAQLLQVAVMMSDGDLKKAQELIDFYNNNLNLPDFDPAPPTFFQQAKDTAGGVLDFFKEHQNELVNGYQIISTLIKNKGVLPAIATEAEEAAAPLEDIN